MIAVNGSKTDYAIMKQVQQLLLAFPAMKVVTLDDQADFSGLGKNDPLYLVSHGGDRSLRNIVRPTLRRWLIDVKLGLPKNFNGGIVILSCYSGLKNQWKDSLADWLAGELAGRAASGMQVAGAKGYSFGTPEFGRSGRSSVLPMSLASFYNPDPNSTASMVMQWLKLTPTHTGGVLHDKLGLKVDISKTIKDQLAAVQNKTPDKIAEEYATDFAEAARRIEDTLKDIIESNRIPGDTVASRAAFLATQNANSEVINWNAAIKAQDDLFTSLYLFAAQGEAFQVARVP